MKKETVHIDILKISKNGDKESCSLSEYWVNLLWEKGSGTSWTSSAEDLPE